MGNIDGAAYLKVNNNGKEEIIELLGIYQSEKYGREYLHYTKGEEVDADNEWTYISILEETSKGTYKLKEISDPEEIKEVEEMIQQEIDELKRKR